MTPEGKVKIWAKKQYGLLFPGHWRVSPRGGPFGKTGCPDDLICWRGVFIAIEVKSDDGSTSALQDIQLRRIRDAGGVAAVLRGRDMDRLIAVRRAALKRIGDPNDLQGI